MSSSCNGVARFLAIALHQVVIEEIMLGRFLLVLVVGHVVDAFAPMIPPMGGKISSTRQQWLRVGTALTAHSSRKRLKIKERSSFIGNDLAEPIHAASFDPLYLASSKNTGSSISSRTALSAASVLAPLALWTQDAVAAAPLMTPETFNPVCPASDNVYRILQGTTEAVVGKENVIEYGPLIAGGLLRIRLELCVVESFFNEAIGPFIAQNGLSWVLPLHETVETFLAGTIFSLASTFILVGSTKIVAVIITYFDVFLGVPSRVLGNFFFDRARGKPVTLDIGFGPFKTRLVGPPQEDIDESKADDLSNIMDADPLSLAVIVTSGIVKTVGEVSKVLRDVFDALDLFVGRYLVLIATGYIGLKFLHFKVFPDFPPF